MSFLSRSIVLGGPCLLEQFTSIISSTDLQVTYSSNLHPCPITIFFLVYLLSLIARSFMKDTLDRSFIRHSFNNSFNQASLLDLMKRTVSSLSTSPSTSKLFLVLYRSSCLTRPLFSLLFLFKDLQHVFGSYDQLSDS